MASGQDRKKKPEETENKTSRPRKRRRRLSPLGILLAVTLVLMLTAGVLAAIQALDLEADKAPEIHDAPAGELAFEIEAGRHQNLLPLGTNRLIQPGGSRISILNLTGSEEFSLNVTMGSPRAVVNENLALVYDEGNYLYYILDRSGLLYQGQAPDPIESAVLSEDGHTALILNRADTRGVLRILSPEGRLLMDWVALDRESSGYLLTAAFSPAADYIDVSLLNTNHAKTYPLINRFSLEADKIGERLAQFQPRTDSPILAILNQDDETTAFVSSRNFYIAAGSDISEGASFASVYSAAAAGKGAAVIAAATVEGRPALYMLRNLASVDPGKPLPLSDNPGRPTVSGSYTAVPDGNMVWLVKGQDTASARSFDLKSPVLAATVDEEGNILCVTREEVRRITP